VSGRNEKQRSTTSGRVTQQVVKLGIKTYNRVLDLRSNRTLSSAEFPELEAIQQRARARNGMSDHLVPLFLESLSARPSLIVELGVRGGESTFVLERTARLCESALVSVDIEDCSRASTYSDWVFVKADDIEFARRFPAWCEGRGLVPSIDVLFLDTSHEFEHTRQEIIHWFPLLSERAKVFFHDTNLRRYYVRKDGSIGRAWDNQRGVIRAIEAHFGKSFDETKDFATLCDGWLIKHYARCLGFTTLERVGTGGGRSGVAAPSGEWADRLSPAGKR
jgi:cephalosporin hydroxylase